MVKSLTRFLSKTIQLRKLVCLVCFPSSVLLDVYRLLAAASSIYDALYLCGNCVCRFAVKTFHLSEGPSCGLLLKTLLIESSKVLVQNFYKMNIWVSGGVPRNFQYNFAIYRKTLHFFQKNYFPTFYITSIIALNSHEYNFISLRILAIGYVQIFSIL